MPTPLAFKTDIVQRFLKGKDFADFAKDYDLVKHREGRNTYVPTKEHEALFDKFLKKQITAKEAAAKMGVTHQTALVRFSSIAFKRLAS